MPFALEPLKLAVAALTLLIARFVKGVIGLGLPTVAMGLLQAASLLIVPSFVTNVWQLATGPRLGALTRRLWPMMAGVVAGTLAGSGISGVAIPAKLPLVSAWR